jgi:hypothetical protein
MSSSPKNNDPIPRTVEVCERYLDRLALVVQRAGTNGATFVPLVRRLERELAEAKEEEEVLERLRHRLTNRPNRQADQ